MAREVFKIKAKVWLYTGGAASWHFVSLPKNKSEDIQERFGSARRGWGSIPVIVTIGETTWKTSIFPDKKTGTYFLPLKAEVRKKTNIAEGDTVNFTIEI